MINCYPWAPHFRLSEWGIESHAEFRRTIQQLGAHKFTWSSGGEAQRWDGVGGDASSGAFHTHILCPSDVVSWECALREQSVWMHPSPFLVFKSLIIIQPGEMILGGPTAGEIATFKCNDNKHQRQKVTWKLFRFSLGLFFTRRISTYMWWNFFF